MTDVLVHVAVFREMWATVTFQFRISLFVSIPVTFCVANSSSVFISVPFTVLFPVSLSVFQFSSALLIFVPLPVCNTVDRS